MNNRIQIERDNDTENILVQFENEIKKKIFKDEFDELLTGISNIYRIPTKTLKLKASQIILNNYNFEKNSFENIYIYSKIYLYFLISIFCLFIFNLLKTNYKFKEKYDLILPDIEQKEQILRLDKLFKEKRIFCIFKNSKIKNKIKNSLSNLNFHSIHSNLVRFDKENFIDNKEIFRILHDTYKISKKNKINYFFIINIIFLSIFKNLSIFKAFKSKYLLIDRFYSSCAIRDFYFKKNGGKFSMSTQKSLLETSLTKYSIFDILFTLGEEKIIKEKLFNYAKIDRTYPIGSFFYEHRNTLNKISKKIEYEFDVVFLGINFTRSVFISNKVIDGYFKALHWLKQYSQKNPHLKIIVKHHDTSKVTNKEREIFKNSNIKFVENSNFYGESYDYCYNSKIICSFGSALLLESSIFNKNIFFFNPHNLNKDFFEIQKFEEIQITNYDDMEKKFSGIFDGKNIDLNDTNKYCLKGNPTEKLIKFLDTNN
tara:strand:- start:1605 stop:3056 length:1452 start_codon:yes stop_codon:yes gene_type:complete